VSQTSAFHGLLRAGLVGAARQALAVAVMTSVGLFMLYHSAHGDARSGASGVRPVLTPTRVDFGVWALILIAGACALTRDHTVELAAKNIKRASRALFPTAPMRAVKVLLAQCIVGALALSALGLEGPSTLRDYFDRAAGASEVVAYFWAAALSVGVAALGSTAHAAYRALR